MSAGERPVESPPVRRSTERPPLPEGWWVGFAFFYAIAVVLVVMVVVL